MHVPCTNLVFIPSYWDYLNQTERHDLVTWKLLVVPRGAATHQAARNGLSGFQPPSGAMYHAANAPDGAVDGIADAPDSEFDPAGNTPENAVDSAPDGPDSAAFTNAQGNQQSEGGSEGSSLNCRRLGEDDRQGERQQEEQGKGNQMGLGGGRTEGEGERQGEGEGEPKGKGSVRSSTGVASKEGVSTAPSTGLEEASHQTRQSECSKQQGLLGRWLRVKESSAGKDQHPRADVAEYKWSVLPCSSPVVPPSQWISKLRERGISEINIVGDSHQRFFALHLFYLLTGVAEYGFRKGHSEKVFEARNERNETLVINFAWVDGIYRNGEHRCW